MLQFKPDMIPNIKSIKDNLFHYIAWLLIAVLYAPVFYDLYRQRWDSVDYTHAYFILPISLWLAWQKRKSIAGIMASPAGNRHSFGMPLLIIGILMFIFGWRQGYLFITTLSLIPVLCGAMVYLYGTAMVRLLAFPIFYLLLLVPPPLGVLDSITIPMRYGVSAAVAGLLKALHYPITRDGLLLSMGGHEIYMGAPCSGFRSLITMISLGLVYVYIIKGARAKKTALLASIVPFALLGNFVRVTGVCLVTYYFGAKVGEKFHDVSGFVIFAVLIAGLMGLEAVLEKRARTSST